MSKTKNQVRHCVGQLKILADETRLRVIHEIMEKPKSVTEINQTLKIEPSLLSHHLKVLKDSELVSTERSGKNIFYKTSAHVSFGKKNQTIDLGCCKLNFNEKT